MNDAAREVLAEVLRDVEAALASARRLWPQGTDEAILRTGEAFLVHLREQRRHAGGTPANGITASANPEPASGRPAPPSSPYAPTEKQVAFSSG